MKIKKSVSLVVSIFLDIFNTLPKKKPLNIRYVHYSSNKLECDYPIMVNKIATAQKWICWSCLFSDTLMQPIEHETSF